MALRMRVEPDCRGRCACSQTAAHSAIASITGCRKSFGWGLVKRIRSIPSTASHARSSSPNSVCSSGARSRPHELTFWPRRVTSCTPPAARRVTSAPADLPPAHRRHDAVRALRVAAHRDLHPGLKPPLSVHGQLAREAALLEAELPPRDAESGSSEPLAEMRDRTRTEGDIHAGIQLEQTLALSLRIAAADRDHLVGIPVLECGGLRQMRRKLRVRLLPDRAGIEDEDVCLFLRHRLAEAELFEHALDPLAVMSVHLAAERRDVVPPHGPEWYPWSFRTLRRSGCFAWRRSPYSPSRGRPSSMSSSRAPSRAAGSGWHPWPVFTLARSSTWPPRRPASESGPRRSGWAWSSSGSAW